MRTSAFAIASLAICLATADAHAQQAPAAAEGQPQPPSEQERREREGIAAFVSGRYADAVTIFAQLYAEFGKPLYLRNIGRAYQKLRQPDQAIDKFQDYLQRAKELSPADEKEVRGYITEMEALRAQSSPRPASPPAAAAAAPAAPGLATLPGPVAVPDSKGTGPSGPRPSPKRRTPLRAGALAALIAATGLVVAGGVTMANAWSKYEETKDGTCAMLGPNGCIQSAEAMKNASRNSRLFFAGAGLTLLTGGVLLYLQRSPSGQPEVAVGVRGTF
jgi:hypothetical protein